MKAIYPGTFDPITNGHIDIARRAKAIFQNVIVAVAENNTKDVMFSLDERVEIAKRAFHEEGVDVVVMPFSNLLVDFMTQNQASVIIRGLRVNSDFEYEFQMSCINSRLSNKIDTIFLPAKEDMHFISSRVLKSVAKLGGDVSSFVPNCVVESFKKRNF